MEADQRRRSPYLLIGICFLLSGFAALLYETVWLRQFAIILGTSEQALAVILASYMGGLAIGSWVASKTVDRITRPVWTYGVLEAGIAICAIAMPWGLGLVTYLQVLLFGNVAEPPAAGSMSQIVFGMASSFALILLPTAMMGATLPLLAKHVVHRDRDVGPRIGILYGINTFGAVAGTLAAAFVLLPSLGLKRTTWIGAAVNLGIFALIYLVVQRSASSIGATAESDSTSADDAVAMGAAVDQANDSKRFRLVVWFAAAAGAVGFCYEIIFTRMLSHILGGSIYAFATMLAGFLLGIALGGTIGSRLAIKRDRSVVVFAYAQALAGVCALVAFRAIDHVAGWSFTDWGGTSTTFSQVAVSILILLPIATFIGATFPLATRILAHDETEAATGSARVYFFNTVGGIAGALVAGILLLPSLAYDGSTYVAVLVNATLAMGLVWVMRARSVHLTAGIVTLVLLFCFAPSVPMRVMRMSALDGKLMEGEMIFSQVGRSGTVALFDQQGDTRFMTNGLPEAFVARIGSRDPSRSSGTWLTAIPPIVRPDCESMLIVGLGGGVAAAYVPPSVEEIDIFELEPAVLEANRFIRDRRDRDPLADRRIKIILNDGRNGLALTSKTYDAIVSQPSHPWTAGASHLYTREFAETVRRRLHAGGVFLQWMGEGCVDGSLFRSLAATLLDVFPHVRVYEPFPGNYLFVASDAPLRPEAIGQPRLDMDPRDVEYYKVLGLESPTHLFAMLRIDEPELRELSSGAPLITDEYNLLAMQAPQLLANKESGEQLKMFLDDYSAYRQTAAKIREDCPQVDVIALGLRLAGRETELAAETVRELVGSDLEMSLYEALIAKKSSQLDRWAELLREAAQQHVDDPRPAFLLLAHDTLGTYKTLDDTDAQQLQSHLNDRYQRLLTAIQAISRNDLAAVQQSDSLLASFDIDEIGYELAVRLRVLWRIADEGPDRVRHGREALQLVAEAMPFLGLNALVPFQVMAAIKSNQQEVALAATVNYAKSVVEQIKQKKVTDRSTLEAMRSNLIRCHDMIKDRSLLPSIPARRYGPALEYVEKVIAGNV